MVKVHEGVAFRKWAIFSAVGNNASSEVLIVTGAKSLHLKTQFSQEGTFQGFIYEDTTTSADGTSLGAPTNFNRTFGGASLTTTTHTPTITDDGTLLCSVKVAGGSVGQPIGASVKDDIEWVFKPESKYLFRMTNLSGVAKDQFMAFEWSEE